MNQDIEDIIAESKTPWEDKKVSLDPSKKEYSNCCSAIYDEDEGRCSKCKEPCVAMGEEE